MQWLLMVLAAVKVHSIRILGPDDGFGPKSVKTFINSSTLGFSEADAYPAAQEFELTEENLLGEPITLRCCLRLWLVDTIVLSALQHLIATLEVALHTCSLLYNTFLGMS